MSINSGNSNTVGRNEKLEKPNWRLQQRELRLIHKWRQTIFNHVWPHFPPVSNTVTKWLNSLTKWQIRAPLNFVKVTELCKIKHWYASHFVIVRSKLRSKGRHIYTSLADSNLNITLKTSHQFLTNTTPILFPLRNIIMHQAHAHHYTPFLPSPPSSPHTVHRCLQIRSVLDKSKSAWSCLCFRNNAQGFQKVSTRCYKYDSNQISKYMPLFNG